jgi:hypothetical protein
MNSAEQVSVRGSLVNFIFWGYRGWEADMFVNVGDRRGLMSEGGKGGWW